MHVETACRARCLPTHAADGELTMVFTVDSGRVSVFTHELLASIAYWCIACSAWIWLASSHEAR
jgi:hypothetical protein